MLMEKKKHYTKPKKKHQPGKKKFYFVFFPFWNSKTKWDGG